MKKLVYSALALTLVSVPALASDNGWSGLDKSIDGLASSLADTKSGGGPHLGGFVRTSYRHSTDFHSNDSGFPGDDGTPATDPDDGQTQSGFQFDNVRIEITGDAGDDWGYKVSFDFGDTEDSNLDATVPVDTDDDPTTDPVDFDVSGKGTSKNRIGVLKDAYVTFKLIDQIQGRVGRFKQPVLRSGLVSDSNLILLDRTGLGEVLGGRRDIGIMLKGSFEVIEWKAAMQNGLTPGDGQGNDQTFTLRVAATIIGKGIGDDGVEGAYGASDEANLMVAAAIFDDTNLVDGLVFAGEATLTMGPFSISGEIADIDDGTPTAAHPGGSYASIKNPILNRVGISGKDSNAAGTTPWDITATYRINEQYEVAARYEDADDVDDTTSYTFGVNRYISGHRIKLTAEWTAIKTDNDVGDVDQFGAGVCVGF